MPSLRERISTAPLKTLVFFGFLLLLSGNWLLPLMDRDEPKFAEASREMLQRADFVVPRFNGQYRFDKPPLIYWCQAACCKLLGQNSFSVRLPSAVFATATSCLLFVWGRRLGNPRAGLYAGVMFVSCLQVLIHGRLAVADMPMIFFVAAAAWSGWEGTRPNPGRKWLWWWMFFGSLALGFLAKGPVAWLPLGGVLLGRWLRPAEFRVSWLTLGAGILLTLSIISFWGVPALIETNGQFFSVGIGRHVVYRSLGIMEGHGGTGWIGFILTLPLYFLTFFVSFSPWAFQVPRLLREWWANKTEDTFGLYLLVQSALVFAVFTLVRTKLPHYTLPAFPLLSLWLAMGIEKRQGAAQWLTRRALLMGLLALIVTLGAFPVARHYFVAADLYRQASPCCSPEMQIAAVGFDEPSLVWEFRRISTNYVQNLNSDEAKTFLQLPGPRMLTIPAVEFTPEIRRIATNAMIFHSVGLDTARFRRLDLWAILKPGAD